MEKKFLPSVEKQREAQQMQNAAIRAWATDKAVGTKAQSFKEVLRVPTKSLKNIKR